MTVRVCSFCGTRDDEAGALIEAPGKVAICSACVALASDLVKERTTPAADMVLDNIGVLATNDPRFAGVLGVVTNAAVAIKRGRIAWSGPSERLPQGLDALPRLDCEGRVVMPGLVDAHTHLLFAGERIREFSLRMVGISEAEAVVRGGGPAATASATQELEADDFAELIIERLGRMLEFGTTTVEASAGYTTAHDDELDLLEIAGMINKRQPVDLVRTFDVTDLPLLPTERTEMIRTLVSGAFGRAAGIVDAIRVSCGKETLAPHEAKILLEVAAQANVRTRIHAGPAASGEISQLAVDAGVDVIDHCGEVDRTRVDALLKAGTLIVVTPTTLLANRDPVPPVQELIAAGVAVAIGTDASPAPLLVESLPLAISMAVLEMGFSPDQAVWSATRGGAIALGLSDRGWIGHGAIADLLILDAPSPAHLAYRPGTDLVWRVFKQGVPVVSR
jgi:imidazolonepropionase